MPNFELRHLRYFLAVAEELHFGRAAKRLGIAQPPLSQQIRQLETLVGAELLRRTSRSTELTPAGAVFLDHARQILKDADRAAAAAQRAARGEIDTLVVGFTDSAALSVLPDLVRRFTAQQPNVHLEMVEGLTQPHLAALEAGAVDVALVRGPVRNPSLRTETLVRESFVIALPDDHRLARKRSTPLAVLATESFVLFPRRQAPEFYDQVIALCIKAGFSPDTRAEASDYQGILSLVAAGLGVAILPASVENLPRAGVKFLPLSDVRTKATVILASRRDSDSRSLRAFIEIARSM